ncbi:hypothetical protein NM688_g6460 [Phlebia brevispora]|uniref:Uncharacterized protein n=1 Tax=Phlebia brevispora TaxID=194682 RepID=A0ACC1SG52_9APHY|nr:hypothetical protein NM688_g6460 [Phlebia brevispora]
MGWSTHASPFLQVSAQPPTCIAFAITKLDQLCCISSSPDDAYTSRSSFSHCYRHRCRVASLPAPCFRIAIDLRSGRFLRTLCYFRTHQNRTLVDGICQPMPSTTSSPGCLHRRMQHPLSRVWPARDMAVEGVVADLRDALPGCRGRKRRRAKRRVLTDAMTVELATWYSSIRFPSSAYGYRAVNVVEFGLMGSRETWTCGAPARDMAMEDAAADQRDVLPGCRGRKRLRVKTRHPLFRVQSSQHGIRVFDLLHQHMARVPDGVVESVLAGSRDKDLCSKVAGFRTGKLRAAEECHFKEKPNWTCV